MANPREYPDEMPSAESGRPMRRGEKRITIEVNGYKLTYAQPGWWCALDDPDDLEGQLVDEDNVIAAAARREARALARQAVLTPLAIRAIRERCGLSQREAARLFGGGPKAFEKYESGEVGPSSSMTRLLLLAARRPDLFRKPARGRVPIVSNADVQLIRNVVRQSSIERIWERIHKKDGEAV